MYYTCTYIVNIKSYAQYILYTFILYYNYMYMYIQVYYTRMSE